MKKISVIGAGTMGASIAQVFAMADCEVALCDRAMEYVELGKGIIDKSLQYMVKKEKISERQKQEILTKIVFTDQLDTCAGSELVVEAVYESMDAKQKIFQALEQIVDEDTVLATNTSSLSVT